MRGARVGMDTRSGICVDWLAVYSFPVLGSFIVG